MKRRVIHIHEDKCTGCGLCVSACHEGAIGLVNGKARLMRDDFCDGLGDCLPACPEDAIEFIEREAADYNEAAVIAAKMQKAQAQMHASMPAGGCPGSMAKRIVREPQAAPAASAPRQAVSAADFAKAQAAAQPVAAPQTSNPFPPLSGGVQVSAPVASHLGQWPIQIKLAPVHAPYFQGCDLLVAADCTAFAYGAFHEDFIKGRICLIGCPKLDAVDYTEKLAAIIADNDVRSVRMARMQVPCCGGLEHATRQAVAASGRDIPVQVVTIAADGSVVAVS